MSVIPIPLAKLESAFSQLDIRGVTYRLGAKADLKQWNPRSTGHLSTPIKTIDHLDCSGFVRYVIALATEQALILPDGSQNQLQWCIDQKLHKLSWYSDANKYITDRRLFIAFIKPLINGAGEVGHVWLLSQYDGQDGADTMESHGGKGVDSRPWSYKTLRNQVYATFELPTK